MTKIENLDTQLNHELKSLEKKRVLINLALVLFIVINALAGAMFIVFLVLFIVSTVKSGLNTTYLVLLFLALAIVLWGNLCYLPRVLRWRKAWRLSFKQAVLPQVFGQMFSEPCYNHDKGIAEQQVRAANVLGKGSIYHSEDLLTAAYKGVGFTYADVCVQFRATSKGSAIGTSFKGQWMIFDFNKPIDAYVRVFERSLIRGNSLLGVMLKNSRKLKGALGAAKGKVEGGQKVEVEDIAFNKKFEIVTLNPHTAFYILTPQFIQAVKHLERQISGQLILAFCDNRLHVAVNSAQNCFEAKLAWNAEKNAQTIRNQVFNIAAFVDILRLDDNYFKQ